MQYRTFPHGDKELSILGFGCMRLPLNSVKSDDINIELATRMVRSAIDRGVNYIDTAYPYHQKMSEPFVARALADGYRQKVALATKLPCWMVESHEDFDRFLDEQLERLQTDRIDYYLIHALDKDRWKKMVELDMFSFLERAQQDGRVAHMGFSFHDDLETFKQIVDAYQWHFCQIQYNYLDTDVQAGSEGLEYAHEKGLGIIVMEPLRGGALTDTIPGDVKSVWDSAPTTRSPAEWALRWVWDDPRVTVVLSGMSTQDQVDENVGIADEAVPHRLSSQELSTIEQVRSIYKKRIAVDCTACGYCMPCPHGVDIPSAFRFYNNAMMFEDPVRYKQEYVRFYSEHLADLCTECGACEPQCPQHIPIIESLKKVTESFLRS
jgi:predicted aldo/keto reductase-like oxidoreductase